MIRLFWCRGSDEEIWNEIMKEASEELTRKKSFRKAQNRKSTEKDANSNGISSRATDTTAKEAKKNEAQAASLYQCDEPEMVPMVEVTLDRLEKLTGGRLYYSVP